MAAMTKSDWLECVIEKLTPHSNREHPDLPRAREGLSKLNARELAALENLLATKEIGAPFCPRCGSTQCAPGKCESP